MQFVERNLFRMIWFVLLALTGIVILLAFDKTPLAGAAVVLGLGWFMVSTWRFYSFKDINFKARQPARLVVLIALLIAGIVLFSRPVLFVIALTYMFSGIFWRLHWIFRRKRNPPSPPYQEVSQTS